MPGSLIAVVAVGGSAGGIALVATSCDQHVGLGVIPTSSGGKGGDGSTGSGGRADNGGNGGAGSAGRGGNGGATTVLWKSTFETMDLSEWTSDAAGGYLGDPPSVGTDVVHRGKAATKLTVAPKPGQISVMYLFREAPSPTEAYYSAWFYLPSTFTIPAFTNYLSLFHFNASTTGDGKSLTPLWDLNFFPEAVGLVPQLYSYTSGQIARQSNSQATWTAPRDTWFHVEMLFVKSSTATGHITVWFDDNLVIDLNKVVTVPNDWLQWNAGGGADVIQPSPTSIYMDDAAISTTRLGSQPLP